MPFEYHYKDEEERVLLEELNIKEYLLLFDHKASFLPSKVLRPLTKEEATSHYLELLEVKTKPLDLLFPLFEKLPFLDPLLPFFHSGQLEQTHLFLLGQFLTFSQKIEEILGQKGPCLEEIQKILSASLTPEYRAFILTGDEITVREEMKNLDLQIFEKMREIEEEIAFDTGLHLTYPYGKEITTNHPCFEKAKTCRHLKYKEQFEFVTFDIVIPKELELLKEKKTDLENIFKEHIGQKLARLNATLKQYARPFEDYYRKLQNFFFQMVLVYKMENEGLILPTLTEDFLFKGEGLSLYGFSHYVPLTLELERGPQVLFGPNMSGKTTTLKTLYFHLWCVRVGLPVMARHLKLFFPSDLFGHFKSSGRFQKGLSSFGEELELFKALPEKGFYLLVDELFHSTNPTGGAILAKMFLRYLKEQKAPTFFLCSSHYPELVEMQEISLIRMDEDFRVRMVHPDEDRSLFLEENLYPLQLALKFSLPQVLKDHIQQFLNERKTKG